MNIKLKFYVVMFALVAFAGCTEHEMKAPPKMKPFKAIPFTLQDVSGKKISFDDYAGKSVILNFWATWCAPCVKEMPLLDKLGRVGKRVGLEVIVVNYKETLDTVRKFTEKNDYGSPTVLVDESGKLADQYQVMGLPATFFINSEGMAVYSYLGELTNEIANNGLRALKLDERI